jgi:uncharacterized BrkB/YihY/UPF0761 family membrane protein
MKKEVGEEKVKNRASRWEDFILFGIFFVIGIVFFVSLSVVNPSLSPGTGDAILTNEEIDFKFGLVEMLFAFVFAFLMSAFLIWTKSMSSKNAYLGTLIGIVGAAVIGYAFGLRYRGLYSTGFMIVTGIVVFGYLGRNFWKYRGQDKFIVGEFDDG